MRIRFSFPIFFSSLTCYSDMRLWPFLYQGPLGAVLFFLSNETCPNHEIRLKQPQEMLKEDYKSAFFRCFLWQCFQERKCNLAAHKYRNRCVCVIYVVLFFLAFRINSFLIVDTQLYKRLCLSIHPLVSRLVVQLVGQSVNTSRKVLKSAFSPLPTRPQLVLAVYPALLSVTRTTAKVSITRSRALNTFNLSSVCLASQRKAWAHLHIAVFKSL